MPTGGADILPAMSDIYEEQARQLPNTILTLLRLTGESVESLAEPTGLSAAGLRAIFDGTATLTVPDFLRIAAALRTHPTDLFRMAFRREPVSPDANRALMEKVKAALDLQLSPETDVWPR
jgi:hypothetical protein